MELQWNLDDLYPSFESAAFRRDFARVDSEIEKITRWAASNLKDSASPVEKVEAYIAQYNELGYLLERLSAFANLQVSVEATNQMALKYADRIQKKMIALTQPSVAFMKWLSSLEDLEEILSRSPVLQEHAFIMRESADKAKYLLSEKEEVAIAMLKSTGSKAWTNLQNRLSSTLLVDITIDGEEKKLPLAVVRNMYHDSDAATRKNAYEAELAAYDRIEQSSCACLNAIKGEVVAMTKMRGYASILEMTLIRSRMDRATLDAMLTAIKEFLPTMREYYRGKAKLLHHEHGLPFYDLVAPMGELTTRFTYAEAHKFIVKNFRSFSDKLADYADQAFESHWIDAEPREGKRGGAFCDNLHCIKQSRILANFEGSFDNVRTLAHELGHGYHGACLMDESYMNTDYPMPLAETASIFCETIINNAALAEASGEEELMILETDLASAGQVIVDIFSRYLFETELIRRREDSPLSVDELKECMLNAQKEAYGDGLDHRFLHPYMWLNKPHYYYAESNFYNFPYAFGLLFAKGLYAKYLEAGESFVNAYDDLLSATGKNNIAAVAKMMDVDVASPEFWRSSLELVAQDVRRFLALSSR